eukprot:4035177-Prymnesium_polylepis.2
MPRSEFGGHRGVIRTISGGPASGDFGREGVGGGGEGGREGWGRSFMQCLRTSFHATGHGSMLPENMVQ